MRTSFIAQLCAGLILASLFLPWFPAPAGGVVVPSRLMAEIDPSQLGQWFADQSATGKTFAASFALAALMLFFGFMGSTPRLVAVLTGGLPVALAAIWLIRAYQEAAAVEAKPDIALLFRGITDRLEAGVWLWLGAGAALLFLAIFDRAPPARRR